MRLKGLGIKKKHSHVALASLSPKNHLQLVNVNVL